MPCSSACLVKALQTPGLIWCCLMKSRNGPTTRPCLWRSASICTHSQPWGARLMVALAFSGRTLSCCQVRGFTMFGMYRQLRLSCLAALWSLGRHSRTLYHPSLIRRRSDCATLTVIMVHGGWRGGSPVSCLVINSLWLDFWMFFRSSSSMFFVSVWS
jgi:hypothetical protein